LEAFIEENGDEGMLVDAMNEKGKITKAGVKERLKAIKNEEDNEEERGALTCCLQLMEAESEAGSAVREAQTALDEKVLAKYAKLTEAEIHSVVVDDKWFVSIFTATEGEVQRLKQRLAARVKELDERYAEPLPLVERHVGVLSFKVEGHLKEMGLAWR
jgi:type I restriction enzyme M protein